MPATRKSKAPSATAPGRIELLLEDMRDQNRATLEAVMMLGDEMRGEIGTLRRELCARLDVVEAVVREHSADVRDLRNDVSVLQVGIRELQHAVRIMTTQAEMHALQARVERLEALVLPPG